VSIHVFTHTYNVYLLICIAQARLAERVHGVLRSLPEDKKICNLSAYLYTYTHIHIDIYMLMCLYTYSHIHIDAYMFMCIAQERLAERVHGVLRSLPQGAQICIHRYIAFYLSVFLYTCTNIHLDVYMLMCIAQAFAERIHGVLCSLPAGARLYIHRSIAFYLYVYLYTYSQTVYNIKSTRSHTQRELIQGGASRASKDQKARGPLCSKLVAALSGIICIAVLSQRRRHRLYTHMHIDVYVLICIAQARLAKTVTRSAALFASGCAIILSVGLSIYIYTHTYNLYMLICISQASLAERLHGVLRSLPPGTRMVSSIYV